MSQVSRDYSEQMFFKIVLYMKETIIIKCSPARISSWLYSLQGLVTVPHGPFRSSPVCPESRFAEKLMNGELLDLSLAGLLAVYSCR